MSVLVKNMIMPRSCLECPMFNGHGCRATSQMFHPITNVAVRVDSCPLVEIETPEPADVVPVIHGRWLPIVSYNNTYKCSECGRLLVNITDGLKMVAKHYPYCHCGAKMDAYGEE